MPSTFALSWYRTQFWADKLHKPVGRAVSDYRSTKYAEVEHAARHINKLNPEFHCEVEVFT